MSGVIGADKLRWLDEVLKDASDSPRPTPWERDFLRDVRKSRERFGEHLHLSDAQMIVLRRVEGKIYAAG